MTRAKTISRVIRAIGLAALAVGCGNTSVALGGSSAGAPGDAGAATGGSAGTRFGYGLHGYGFGGYGGSGWAGEANTAGATSVGTAGFGGSTAAESCVGYQPGPSANAPRLDSCDAVTLSYEFQDAKLGIAFGYADGTPGATETHKLVTLDPALCGDTDAWHLTAFGQAAFGGSYEFTRKTLDYSQWDGLALWIRAAQGTTASFLISSWDGISLGKKVIDPVTGEKACYNPGDDWDLDGQPNLSLPPPALLCQGWNVTLTVDDQWHFVMLPWSLWTNTSSRVTKAGMDPSSIQLVQLYTFACSDFDVSLASLGAYRALPQP